MKRRIRPKNTDRGGNRGVSMAEPRRRSTYCNSWRLECNSSADSFLPLGDAMRRPANQPSRFVGNRGVELQLKGPL